MKHKLHQFTLSLFFFIFSVPISGQDFENGEVGIALNDYGRVRVYSPGLDSLIQIDRFSALIGNNISEVFDYKKDAESVDTSRTVENPMLSDYELYGSSDNAWSGLPPNYLVKVNVYGWNSGGYALAKYTFVNKDGDAQTPIIGFEGIAYIDGVYGFESTEYLSDVNTMDMFVGDASTHTGFQILSHPLKTLHSIEWYDGYSDSDTLFWENMNHGSIDALFESGSEGSVNFMALDPTTVNLDDSLEVWVAIAVGADRDAMKANMQVAAEKYASMSSVAGPPEFENGEIGITLNDYGRLRVYSPGLDSLIQIDRFSALVGNNISEVFDYKKDAEMLDSALSVPNPTMSDYELYVSADNAWSGLPPNYVVNVNVYGWNSGGYALAKFTFLNNDGDTQNPIIGFEGIAYIDGVYGFESTEYLSDVNTMDMFVGDASTHTGFQILSHPLKTLHSIDWYDGYSDSDTLFWENINHGSIDALYESGSEGSVNFMALDPIAMNLNDTEEVWVAIAVGADRDAMKTNMLEATAKYETLTDVEKVGLEIPNNYLLSQNYPNPFNPSTKISFSLPNSAFVSLSVYNALGQKVETLVDKDLSAGNYTLDFNGSNLSSGIYFYKISADNFSSVKKMMLIK